MTSEQIKTQLSQREQRIGKFGLRLSRTFFVSSLAAVGGLGLKGAGIVLENSSTSNEGTKKWASVIKKTGSVLLDTAGTTAILSGVSMVKAGYDFAILNIKKEKFKRTEYERQDAEYRSSFENLISEWMKARETRSETSREGTV